MYRSYGHRSSSYPVTDEYLERLKRIERMPSMIADTPHFPNVHEIFNNKLVYVEENNDHQKTNLNKTHHQKKNHQSPHAVQQKVHFVEHEKKMGDIGRDGKRDAVEEKTIDMEAEGFIQQKHKSFELCKWGTFKVY